MPRPIGLLLVDDARLFSQRPREMLAEFEAVEVIGDAAGVEARLGAR